jgi:DNA modification methylase
MVHRMKPYYEDDALTLLHGDALACARDIPARSVQTIVTSPPYFGLRDYGDEEQIGVESTPAEYVARIVSLFGELRRVLSDDGTLWLNLGDSYLAQQLVGIPWMAALALKAEGWRLRSDIIWSKPDAMPEGHVKNRPTKAHEYLFLFAKSDRYFFDSAGITEPVQHDHLIGKRRDRKHDSTTLRNDSGSSNYGKPTRIRRSVWTVPNEHFPGAHFAVYPTALIRPCILAGSRPGDTVLDPFSGSGTTGMVATQEGRKYIGFDINSDYLDLSLRTRLAQPTLSIA